MIATTTRKSSVHIRALLRGFDNDLNTRVVRLCDLPNYRIGTTSIVFTSRLNCRNRLYGDSTSNTTTRTRRVTFTITLNRTTRMAKGLLMNGFTSFFIVVINDLSNGFQRLPTRRVFVGFKCDRSYDLLFWVTRSVVWCFNMLMGCLFRHSFKAAGLRFAFRTVLDVVVVCMVGSKRIR